MTMRYIGSKARVADAILEIIGDPTSSDVFVDGFCGTGAVAERAAQRGWPIRLNDTLVSATITAAARITHASVVPFTELGGYQKAIEVLDSTTPVEGFIWREYSPASAEVAGVERKYFTQSNAAELDAMRLQISEWQDAGALSSPEAQLLIADVLKALNGVANIAGTYGCFLREFAVNALQPIRVRPRKLFPLRTAVEVWNVDVTAVPTSVNDVVYFDPPYTKRQYAAYYHILETVAVGDEPTVGGVTGLRPWQDKASAYCYKRRALKALVELLDNTPSRRVVLSYSSEGHVDLNELTAELAQVGEVVVHPLGAIGRYRPNQVASATASSVAEYVIELVKAPAFRAVA